MKLFADSTDPHKIKELVELKLINGVTTNPSLIAKSGKNMKEVLTQICQICSGPISAEVVALDSKTMYQEAIKLSQIADNIVVKLPLTEEGLLTCHLLSADNIKTNITLCFSSIQALMAARAGATYISPFIGRLDDAGVDGLQLIREIRQIYDHYPELKTFILAASIRSTNHLRDCALAGADYATAPPALIRQSLKHTLTDKGLADFLNDWKKTGQKIV